MNEDQYLVIATSMDQLMKLIRPSISLAQVALYVALPEILAMSSIIVVALEVTSMMLVSEVAHRVKLLRYVDQMQFCKWVGRCNRDAITVTHYTWQSSGHEAE